MSFAKKKMLSQAPASAPIPTGTDNFAPVLYTGNGSTVTITGLNFQPDMVFNKHRTASFPSYMTDVVRGVGIVVRPSENEAQSSGDGVSSFDSNGFKMTGGGSNQNNGSYVAWAWKAGGAAVSNTSGTITSQVSANTEAGFSIASYTGNGSQNATIGHGLTSPSLILVKNLSQADAWFVGSTLLGSNEFMELNNASGKTTNSDLNYEITSTAFKTTSSSPHDMINESGENYIMYAFASISGYQKIGTYNGTSATNRIYTTDNGTSSGANGFQPRYLVYKNTNGAYAWVLIDSARGTNKYLFINTGNDNTGTLVTFNSDGFTLLDTGVTSNVSGSTYLYWAIA